MSRDRDQYKTIIQRWAKTRHKFLAVALLAFFLQATLPFFLTTCPVYAAAGGLAKTQSVSFAIAQPGTPKALADAGTPADCPMHSAHQDSIPADPNQKHVLCSLCDAMSPFHGYVTAGLIDLPPPIATQQVTFFPIVVSVAPAIRAAAFGARAPPLSA
jgi:hypothetical protein